jgi:hypothetical protein
VGTGDVATDMAQTSGTPTGQGLVRSLAEASPAWGRDGSLDFALLPG